MVQKEKSSSQQNFTIPLVISGLKMSAQDAFAHVDLCTQWLYPCMWARLCIFYTTERLPQAVTFSSLFCDINTPFLFEVLSQTQWKSLHDNIYHKELMEKAVTSIFLLI